MILAPNHRLQLNGSKFLLLILSSVILLSCSTSQALYKPGNVPPIPKKQEPVVQQKNPVDTVKWEVVEEEVKPPIQSAQEEVIPLNKKAVYNVALMLPFEANSVDAATKAITENSGTNRFLSFYAGSILALGQLEREGLTINVDVYDSQRLSLIHI